MKDKEECGATRTRGGTSKSWADSVGGSIQCVEKGGYPAGVAGHGSSCCGTIPAVYRHRTERGPSCQFPAWNYNMRTYDLSHFSAVSWLNVTYIFKLIVIYEYLVLQ